LLHSINDPRAPLDQKGSNYYYDTDGYVDSVLATGQYSRLRFQYDWENNKTYIYNEPYPFPGPSHGTTVHQYGEQGQLASITDACGNVTTYGYNDPNNPYNQTSVTNEKGTTNYTFDQWGNTTKIADPFQKETTFIYKRVQYTPSYKNVEGYTWAPEMSSLEKMIDAKNRVTKYIYDGNGNPTEISVYEYEGGPLVSRTSYTYNSAGWRTSITEMIDAAHNRLTTYDYDEGYLSKVTVDPNGLNLTTEYHYDVLGRCEWKKDANQRKTSYIWDDNNRLIEIRYPDLTTVYYGYDANGNRTVISDANQKTTSYTYVEGDLLTDVNAPIGHTKYEHNIYSNLTALIDAREKRTDYEYDNLDRLTKVTYPISSVGSRRFTTYGYDGVGNRTSMTDGNYHTIDYTYDSCNRLVHESSSDYTADYQYDDVGNKTYASNSGKGGAYNYTYDALNRITDITFTPNAMTENKSYAISYKYDGTGNRTEMTYEGRTIKYIYDNANRLVEIQHPTFGIVKYEYDRMGNRTTMTYPNGVHTTHTYNSDNYRLLFIRHYNKRGTMIAHYDYTYDNVENRMTMTDLLGTTSYQYDDLYQLTSASTPNRGTYEYTYDAVGNRLTYKRTKAGQMLENVSDYQYSDANELILAKGIPYHYDGNGNLSLKGGLGSSCNLSYLWNYKNELTRVMNYYSGELALFSYDVDGRRIQKVDSTGTINYLWDGMQVMAEADNQNLRAEYLNGIGEVLGKKDNNGAIFYFLQDGLGSTTYLLDQFGHIVSNYYYEPFGKCWNVQQDPSNNIRFTEKEYSEDIGLYYFGARYYDPTAGRFISRDPWTWGPDDERVLEKEFPNILSNLILFIGKLMPKLDERQAKLWLIQSVANN